MSTATATRPDATTAVAMLIRYLETGEVGDGLFAPDLVADVSTSQWRARTTTADELVDLLAGDHGGPRRLQVSRVEPTGPGFTLEFDEPSSRVMMRADVAGATITELTMYCLSPAPALIDH